ncbi:putative flavoprotein involved in K+ transport [Yimella lutea]|uniref:Putative flavoprotein involved in K+ transport n=1 Tax=Yimella lutea TaxID=587872 RepID=A0A542ED85_9MICO|nr:NAD(P)/FAD-dependent oxidoreductase [Yimella lutea]TQJ13292.1 putative flavoprotein involved in K+ transport [Yimella lutea]
MTDELKTAQQWLSSFEQALGGDDDAAVTDLFGPECYWRDLVTLTWNLHTAESVDEITAMLDGTAKGLRPRNIRATEAADADGVIEAWFEFDNDAFNGKGLVRLRDGKAWTLLTTSQELVDFPENRGTRRPLGAEHGNPNQDKNWLDHQKERQARLGYEDQPYVVIVGGGQGGIGLGARLKQLGVPTLIIDKHPRPGDQWRNRYHSLCLHDPVWYDHLPYLPFPANWPVFTPKDKIGDWLESYTKIMELDYWSNTECVSADYDESTQKWTVKVMRDGSPVTLEPSQLVLATGMSGVPNMPTVPGMETFKGEIQHSSQHPGGDAYAGKKAVVVGSNNSAHDICADLWRAGADVTMLQRSSTHIVRSQSLMTEVLGPLYSEEALANGIDHDKADLIFASIPYKVLPGVQKQAFDVIRENDKEFYDGLEKAGFMLDFGDDDSGLFLKYLRRGSGYYIDIGASDLVAKGEIKLVAPANVDHIDETGVVLDDGRHLDADLIVFATGYGSMNGWAAKLISQEVADKVGKCWGLGSDTTKDPGPWRGELRNMWKPTKQDNLWFHGGNLHQSRHYSRYLSIQLKARMEGLDTPVYAIPETVHLS